MGSLRKDLPTPEEMACALFLPIVRVIAGCAAFIAALYLLIGVDPSGPVGELMVEYVDLALPIAGKLAGFWVFYSIFYLCLGSFDVDLRVAALIAVGLARFWARRAFVQCPSAAAISGPGSLLSTFRLSSWCLPVWLAPRWRPRDSVQLE